MTVGMTNLRLASALITERRLEAERRTARRARLSTRISARATPERKCPSLQSVLLSHEPRQA